MASKKKNVATKETGQAARNVYQQFGDETRTTNIEGDLLRFTKQGEWIHGQEEEELKKGTELIMGINTMKRGWQKWRDQKPVDFRMGLLSDGFRPPSRDELGDTDEDLWEEMGDVKRDPWQETYQVLMLDPKTKEVYTFSTSSKSGRTALGEISTAYGDRLQDGEDKEAMPIVKLMASFYKHKTHGKVMIPIFELTGKWVKPPKIEEKPAKEAKNAKDNKSNKAPPKALAAPRSAAKAGKGSGARI